VHAISEVLVHACKPHHAAAGEHGNALSTTAVRCFLFLGSTVRFSCVQ